MCGVRGSGSGRDRWPRPALPRVSGSAAIPGTPWKPAFGQKGALISTRLSQSASRNEKHWKGRQGCGNHPPKAAGCYLSPSSSLIGLGGTRGWGADSYNTLLLHSWGRGKHRNAAAHEPNSHCSRVRDFGTTRLFLKGLGGPCSLLQPWSTWRFPFSTLTDPFTRCHFFFQHMQLKRDIWRSACKPCKHFSFASKLRLIHFFKLFLFPPLLLPLE